MDIEQQKRQQ
jgi:hypothetical protein